MPPCWNTKKCWAAIMTFMWLLSACAVQQPVIRMQPLPPKPAAETGVQVQAKGWWAARFYMDWAEGAEPSWYMGALIAHQIVDPVLRHYRDEIQLWRFHRRAAHDASGHRFTFYFYTTPQTARLVIDYVRDNELLDQLTLSGTIIRTEYSDPDINRHPRIEDTSDAKWTPALQKAWPYFIMGASQMWLDLIDWRIAERSFDGNTVTLEELQELYREVDAEVVNVWQNEGRHAFLHHLNAIFEYEPLWVYERRLQKF